VDVGAVGVGPGFLSLVAAVDEDDLRVPVVAATGQVVAALDEEDALAGGGEALGEGGAAGSGADDDDVVMVQDGCSSDVLGAVAAGGGFGDGVAVEGLGGGIGAFLGGGRPGDSDASGEGGAENEAAAKSVGGFVVAGCHE